MKLVITGANGQLGQDVMILAEKTDFRVTAVDLPEFDITNRRQVERLFADIRPDIVINAAAYTQVDRAESEPETAFAVNRDGAVNMALACCETGAALIHISTDFVFDGKIRTPYLETDPVNPLSVYGKSKADGEDAVRLHLDRHVIIRTAWLYGVHGGNFVKTMIRLGQERETLGVVADQYGCPTCASDLAETLLSIVQQIRDREENIPWGTFHYCGDGITTWHGLAEAVFEYARKYMELKVCDVRAITTAEYPTPAARPAWSALNCDRIQAEFGVRIQPWRKSLEKTVAAILQKNS